MLHCLRCRIASARTTHFWGSQVHASSEQLSKKEDELLRGRSAQRFSDAHVRTTDRTALEADLSRVKQNRIGVNKKRGVECRGGRPQH